MISTCNRVEIYAEVDRFHGSVEEVSRLLVEPAGEPTESMLPHLYVHYDDGAVSHLFHVAAGLDSMAVGEGQILGQTRERAADRPGARHRRLRPQRALPAGAAGRQALARRDRHRPGRARRWSRAALARLLPGGRRRAAGRGASAPARMAGARHGDHRPPGRRRRGRRQPHRGERAERLAARVRRPRRCRSTGSPHELAERRRRDHLHRRDRGAGRHRRRCVAARPDGRPLAIADLALPHDVDPAVRRPAGRHPGRTGRPRRPSCATPTPVARSTASAGSSARRSQRSSPRADRPASPRPSSRCARWPPTWSRPRWRGSQPGCPTSTRPTRPRSQHSLRRVADKLLHQPTVRVKELANEAGAVSYAAALAELFALDPEAVDAVTRPSGEALS